MCERYRSILPFDPSDLPIHLKACKTPKKKETLRDDVQSAIKASLLTRRVKEYNYHANTVVLYSEKTYLGLPFCFDLIQWSPCFVQRGV